MNLKERVKSLLRQSLPPEPPNLYATPPSEPIAIESCEFYHHFDLPKIGEVGQGWDLRKTIKDYLGVTLGVEYEGKRALDLGAASGFLSFAMEQRGAEVVSYDMASEEQWNIVPYQADRFKEQLPKIREQTGHSYQGIKRSYWFAHKALNSSAKVFYGDVYHLPDELGRFDVVMVGMILPHLRDPFQALYSAARLCDDTIVVTQQCPEGEYPYGLFLPSVQNNPDNFESYHAWWVFSEQCIINMLAVLGFEHVGTKQVAHQCSARTRGENTFEKCSTIVGKRLVKASN